MVYARPGGHIQHRLKSEKMSPNSSNCINPIGNIHGGAVGIVIALVLVLGAASGGGYWAYNKYFKQEPPRTKLASLKVKEQRYT